MMHEARVEAKKHQMLLLLVMGAPSISDPSTRRSWNEQSKKVFTQYVDLIMGIEISEEDKQEQEMMEFYENVVKKVKPTIHKNDSGNVSVKGVLDIFGKV